MVSVATFVRSRYPRLFVLCALWGVLLAVVPAASGEIQWRSPPLGRAGVTFEGGTPEQVADELATLAARPGESRVVLRLAGGLDKERRAALEAAGVSVLSYLGDNCFFATLHANRLDVAAASRAGAIVSARPIDPNVKLHPILASGQTPAWAVVNRDRDQPPVIGTYIVFHRDVSLEQQAISLVELYGGRVKSVLTIVNGLVAELPLQAVYDLAHEDDIQWIEQALPRFSPVNDSNRSITQAEQVQASAYDLDGTGVTVMVYDGGTVRTTHHDFSGRAVACDYSGTSEHATHVAGTIGGDGSASSGIFRGMAPGVTLLSYGFEPQGGVLFYADPGDIVDDYADAIGLGADIANNSIGSNVESNGYSCSLQGDYGVTSELIDAIVRGDPQDPVFFEPFRVVWAGGNERQGSRCDVEGYGDFYSIAPPAGAKNHLAIGALNSNDDSMTSFSGWGPTDDGRIKPDFCAPGCQSSGDFGVTSASSTGNKAYVTYCGTSMASPTMCGLAALVLGDFRELFPLAARPRNSTLKALFAHNAVDLGNAGPDYKFGYGSVRVKETIDFMRAGGFVEEAVSHAGTYSAFVEVAPAGGQLKVTLAWDDYPATPNVNPTLVNDLDLRVYDSSNNRYYPWTLSPTSPTTPAVRECADHVNNIEQVVVDAPPPGRWRIEVVGHHVPEGPQPFSLCASPNLIVPGVGISFPQELPDLLAPGLPQTFPVTISASTEAIVPGTEVLYFRYDGGSWQSSPLTWQADETYLATLPPAVCGASPEFFISVEGDESGVVSAPAGAPSEAFVADVGELVVLFADDFESDTGWTVENDPDLTAGAWQRGVPAGGGDRGDPASDFDGSGSCYLTGNTDGDSDVDGGITWLISPAIDLADEDAQVHYALWYTNNCGADPNNDLFKVYVSNNDGADWVLAETIGPVTFAWWSEHAFDVGDFVVPSGQVRLRFEASDLSPISVVEAAVDDVVVSRRRCDAQLSDCNGNGIVDDDDLASGRSEDEDFNGVPDECTWIGCPGDVDLDGEVTLADLSQLLAGYGTKSGATFSQGDLDNDGDVDLADLAVLLAMYGKPCS